MRWNFEFVEGELFQMVNKKNKKCFNLDRGDGGVGRKGELYPCRRRDGKGEPSDNFEWKWRQKKVTEGLKFGDWAFSFPTDSLSDYPIELKINDLVDGKLRGARTFEFSKLKSKNICFEEPNKP